MKNDKPLNDKVAVSVDVVEEPKRTVHMATPPSSDINFLAQVVLPDLKLAISQSHTTHNTDDLRVYCETLSPSNAAKLFAYLNDDDLQTVLLAAKLHDRFRIFLKLPQELRQKFKWLFSDHSPKEVCEQLKSELLDQHPATIAEFLQLFDFLWTWKFLQELELTKSAEIFIYFDRDLQVEIVEKCPRNEVAKLLEETPSDDRVDLLEEIDEDASEELKKLLSQEDQHDVELLSRYEEDKCGAEMSSDFVRLREDMTVGEAIEEISAQTHLMETVYYLYVLNSAGQLVGVVSAKDLLRRINQQTVPISDFMKSATSLITVDANDDREEAVKLVEKYDFIALPVLDKKSGKMLGVITHDDVLDAAVEELVENAHMSAAVAPLDDESYLDANVFLIARKRFTWLAILLFGAITTALILRMFDEISDRVAWLVAFLPMIVSTGGNSGGQSATLVITALATGEITLADWRRIATRETIMGVILGLAMGICGLINACLIYGASVPLMQLLLVPLSVFCVVFFSNLTGAMLPLVFQKMNLDPALMSNPFVAGVSDTLGTFIYMTLATLLVAPLYS